MKPIHACLAAILSLSFAAHAGEAGDTPPAAKEKPSQAKSGKKKIDRSGRAQHGEASYYADSFAGKKMADGTPMNPDANIAASRTLPLGTKAEVTNLENGKTEQVEIRDRGPYVDGRIVDVSPSVAEKLDMKEDGVAPVVVRPIELPPVEGKQGATASGSSGTGTTVSSK